MVSFIHPAPRDKTVFAPTISPSLHSLARGPVSDEGAESPGAVEPWCRGGAAAAVPGLV